MPVIKYLLGTSASSHAGLSWWEDRTKLVRRLDQVVSSDGRGVRAAGVYFPPMLAKDTELCGEYDGVDAQGDISEGAINPIVRPSGSPYLGGSACARWGA
jgi:hypothetical protein